MIKVGTKFKDMDFFFYVDEDEEGRNFWATPRQIGKLLGFRKPGKAIAKIINLHPESFKHCMRIKFNVNGEAVEKTLFDFKDMLKFCKYSELPKSDVDAIVDFLWEIFDEKDIEEMKEQARNRRSQADNAPKAEQDETECPKEHKAAPDNEAVALLKELRHEFAHLLQQIGDLRADIKQLQKENNVVACGHDCEDLSPIGCLIFKV